MAAISIVDDDVAFAETFLYILDKKKRRIRLRFNRAQKHYLANRTSRDLVLKARQLGMSTAIQGRLFRISTTMPSATITMSHEDATTQKLRRMADRFYKNLPEVVRPVRKYANAAITSYADFDSEAEIGTAGNVNVGRGGTYTDIHGSEFAFWPDAEAVLASVMQGGDPAVVLESTPNGAQGKFYELCMAALDGDPTWKLFFYPWWWDDGYRIALAPGETLDFSDDERGLVDKHGLSAEQIKWRRAKQQELKHLFAQEYPEDPRACFLRSGFGYFGDVSGVFTAPLNAKYDEAHRYVGGLDFGQANDYTDLSVVDATARVQVDLLHINGLPWKEMRKRIIELCLKWHISVILGEVNSMGGVNLESLRTELAAAKCSTFVQPFETTNDSKASIMSALNDVLQRGTFKLLPDEDQKRELAAFKAVQLPSGVWRLTAPPGEHDDTVIGLALSWDAAANARIHGGIHV